MDSAEWFATSDWSAMLTLVEKRLPYYKTKRLGQLLSCALMRKLAPHLDKELPLVSPLHDVDFYLVVDRMIAFLERHADRLEQDEDAGKIRQDMESVVIRTLTRRLCDCCSVLAMSGAQELCYEIRQNHLLRDAEMADAIRDLFGDPFVEHDKLLPGPGRDPIAYQLASEMYEGRAFDRMAELGRILEVQGGVDASAIEHCRRPGEHHRGCWVVDAVLKKRVEPTPPVDRLVEFGVIRPAKGG